MKNEIILYRSNELAEHIEVRFDENTAWLTQAQIAELFGTKRQAITRHLKNIFEREELSEDSVSSILELTAADGKKYDTKIYNLDAIISIGYRVNSVNATLFRRWATEKLRDYLLKGYVVDKRFERLENRVTETENKIDFFVKTALPPIQGIFYDGQIFDAYVFISDLVRQARKSIILVDNYVDDSILLLLSKRQFNITAQIYTKQITPKLKLDLTKHNTQYEPVNIDITTNFHDRFLIIDDTVYHIGASLKDLGKRLFAFSKLEIKPVDLLKNI